MIISFSNEYLQRLFENKPVIGKPHYAADVIEKFKKTVLKLQYADNSRELRKFRGLNFEALKGDRKSYYSVRVDLKYRLIFSIEKDNSVLLTEIVIIEDLSKHYE
jgi:toxin HigB-1